MSNTNQQSIYWDEVIKKEARGAADDSDFGEVQEIGQHYVLTQKGLISKDKFYIPKFLVQGYDGSTLWFNASEDDLEEWKRDSPPNYDEYVKFKKVEEKEVSSDIETRIPVIEERLKVSKRTSTSEATITKEPTSEKKTIEVPVTHEEVKVERRPTTKETSSTSERPVESKTEVKIPVNKEQVDVTKEPYVKEEVIVKKKPVTETETVSDTVKSEKISTSGSNVEEKRQG